LLKANGEDVKVVQELLGHASAKMTLDISSQALTPAKRAAQSKVVNMILHKVVPRGCTADSDPIRASGH
jgi:integrase